MLLSSIAFRKIEHLLGDEAHNQLLGDRGKPRQRGFAVEALDMIFLGVAEAAMGRDRLPGRIVARSEEHTSELQSLMRISYAVFCLQKKKNNKENHTVPGDFHALRTNKCYKIIYLYAILHI